MNNNKQSSIEWYINNLIEILGDEIINKLTIEQTNQTHSLGNKAKAMHRIEILKARQNGLDNGFSNGNWDSQLYYTEEFGGNND